ASLTSSKANGQNPSLTPGHKPEAPARGQLSPRWRFGLVWFCPPVLNDLAQEVPVSYVRGTMDAAVIPAPARSFGDAFTAPRRRREPSSAGWGGVGLVMVLAVALRVMAIGTPSFWFDETFTAAIAKASFWALFTGHVRDDGNPPLYWLLIRLWSLAFGESEIA